MYKYRIIITYLCVAAFLSLLCMSEESVISHRYKKEVSFSSGEKVIIKNGMYAGIRRRSYFMLFRTQSRYSVTGRKEV